MLNTLLNFVTFTIINNSKYSYPPRQQSWKRLKLEYLPICFNLQLCLVLTWNDRDTVWIESMGNHGVAGVGYSQNVGILVAVSISGAFHFFLLKFCVISYKQSSNKWTKFMDLLIHVPTGKATERKHDILGLPLYKISKDGCIINTCIW